MTDDFMPAVLDATARQMMSSTVPDVGSILDIRERHLTVDLKAALKTALKAEPVSRVIGVPEWPSLGRSGVDVVVPDRWRPERARYVAELKWCQQGHDKIYEALWDLFKVAMLTRLRPVKAGYLITGATRQTWEMGFCADLFDGGRFSPAELCARVIPWSRHRWLAWDDLLCGGHSRAPERVPAVIDTRVSGRTLVVSKGHEWELRAVSVQPGSEDTPFVHGWPISRPVGARYPAQS